VLASGSPRRRDLLAAAGIAFEVRTPDVDESPRAAETPHETAARLARAKAGRVARTLDPAVRLVLGADTIVVLGEVPFGKPRDADDAVRLLERLAGRTHEVVTAVALVRSGAAPGAEGDGVWECAVASRVTLRAASRAEIDRYVASGEPLDKAGAYALQGEGRRFVERVEGSETNVIGLPMEETLALLARAARAPRPGTAPGGPPRP